MAGQQSRQDPKKAALAAARCLNPHPEQVTDPEFLGSDFFDARDAVQVKYEMVRKVRADGAPVTEAAAAFGYSRPAYYAAAAALASSGPGVRRAPRPARSEGAFGVRVHPRSVERALARRRERHSKSRGTARPQGAE